jgi:hypothetical protein
MDAVTKVLDAIRPHLSTIGLVVTWAAILFYALRRRRDWKRKRFDCVNVSLNYVVDGKLAMRTLLETTPREVWLNDYGIKLVLAAAARTHKDQPFVVLSNAADMSYIKRAIKNVLSEHFAEAFLAQSQGVPISKATYLFALTYEKYESIRELKFRVVVVEQATLHKTFGPDAPAWGVSNARHKDRLEVLQKMAILAANPGEQVEGADVLDRVELGLIHGA